MATVILYPAIDIRNGQCVRLLRGDMNVATIYNSDPAAQAARFEALGFAWLHIVDLDGAASGHARNRAVIEEILRTVRLPVQLGGGIRDIAIIASWLEAGARRVVLGTAALTDPPLVREACQLFPGRIAVGLDARSGRLATNGWTVQSDVTVLELAKRLEDSGVAVLIHTDIERDGALTGLNMEATLELARAVSVPVIASGGLASLADIERLLTPEDARLAGAICGRALYDGRLDPAAALALIANTEGRSRC
ncbi:MAG TPA: 1-(5-phosphoribosyl)-5-[(5-phosphoribosylamino)methylideneamino]imidazole-4-carboxamide isomerase [Aestuariivirgaceae bacterium]|jgi:phosphoribosylformimino-5-aminoimidazole carboxamide ribotide isomerase